MTPGGTMPVPACIAHSRRWLDTILLEASNESSPTRRCSGRSGRCWRRWQHTALDKQNYQLTDLSACVRTRGGTTATPLTAIWHSATSIAAACCTAAGCAGEASVVRSKQQAAVRLASTASSSRCSKGTACRWLSSPAMCADSPSSCQQHAAVCI